MKSIRLNIMCVVFLLTILISIQAVEAASVSDQVISAPVPTMLATAKKVFIANLGGEDATLDDRVVATGETYNQFYSIMKTWNHFLIVDSPHDADLVLQVCFVPRVIKTGETQIEPARIQLTIVDSLSRTPVWVIAEALDSWSLKSTGTKHYKQAMSNLTEDIKALVQRASLQVSKSST